MMSPALLVGILVAAGEARTPAATALIRAASETLGDPNVSIVVQDDGGTSDRDVLHTEDRLHAAAVVALIWTGPGRTSAHLRVHIAHGDRWIDREMSFSRGDTPIERGRAIGFTLASILLSETALFAGRVAITPERHEPPASRGADEPSASAPPSTTPAPRSPASGGRFAVELGAVGARGFGGPATGFGASANGELALMSALWVRVGGGIREAAVPLLNGDDTVAWGSLGAAWRPGAPDERLRAALCLDLDLMFHDLSHASTAGTIHHGGHALPGATILTEISWRLRSGLAAFAAVGAEFAFGATEIWVAGQLVATIPVVRGLAVAGLRLSF